MALKTPYGNGPSDLGRSVASEDDIDMEDFNSFDPGSEPNLMQQNDSSRTPMDQNNEAPTQASPQDDINMDDFMSFDPNAGQPQGPPEYLGSSRVEELSKGLIDGAPRKYFRKPVLDPKGKTSGKTQVFSVDKDGKERVVDEKTQQNFNNLAELIESTVGGIMATAAEAGTMMAGAASAGAGPLGAAALTGAAGVSASGIGEYLAGHLTDEYRKIGGKDQSAKDIFIRSLINGVAAAFGGGVGARAENAAAEMSLAGNKANAQKNMAESQAISSAAESQGVPVTSLERNPEDINLRKTRDYLESGKGGNAAVQSIENFRNLEQGPALQAATDSIIERVRGKGKSFGNARNYVDSLKNDLKYNLTKASDEIKKLAGNTQFDVSRFMPVLEKRMNEVGINFDKSGNPIASGGSAATESLKKDLAQVYIDFRNSVKKGEIYGDPVTALVKESNPLEFREVKTRISDPTIDKLHNLPPKYKTEMVPINDKTGLRAIPPNEAGGIDRGMPFSEVERTLDKLQDLASFDSANRQAYDKTFGSLSKDFRELRDDVIDKVGDNAKKKLGASAPEVDAAVLAYKKANETFFKDFDDISRLREVVKDDPINAAEHLLRKDRIGSGDYVKSLMKVFDEDGKRELGSAFLQNKLGSKTRDSLTSKAFKDAIEEIPPVLRKELYGEEGMKSLKEMATITDAIERTQGKIAVQNPKIISRFAMASGKSGLVDWFMDDIVKRILAPYPDAKRFIEKDILTAVSNARTMRLKSLATKAGAKAIKVAPSAARGVYLNSKKNQVMESFSEKAE